jgi:nucleoside-diphosphate-sugar epimerase
MISFDSDLGMPDMSYGWAKLTCEFLARLAYQRHGLKSICYRPFSGYGEDQDDAYPFPSICKRVVENFGAETVNVWGTGAQMRDFIHIDDCIEGILTTVDKIDDGDAVNLSTGVLTSFIDFAKLAARIVGYFPEVKGMSNRPTGVHARGGDTAKQKHLGFEASIDFRAGIERAMNWYAERLALDTRLKPALVSRSL